MQASKLQGGLLLNVDHLRSCDYNDGNAGGSDFNDDNFEDCYFTNGHEKDKEVCYLNDDQGVNETPGAYQEASTTYHWQSRPSYTHARTGAKVGFNCTPKVQAMTKPEETTKQDRKGTTNY